MREAGEAIQLHICIYLGPIRTPGCISVSVSALCGGAQGTGERDMADPRGIQEGIATPEAEEEAAVPPSQELGRLRTWQCFSAVVQSENSLSVEVCL